MLTDNLVHVDLGSIILMKNSNNNNSIISHNKEKLR